MSRLDELVAESLEKQKQTYIDQITDAKSKAQEEIDVNSGILRKETDELVGFKIGITPPAYRTNVAGVLERDPLRGYPVEAAAESGDDSLHERAVAVLAIAILAWVFFKKGK